MKKALILTATVLLSACSCFSSNDEPEETYRAPKNDYQSLNTNRQPSESYVRYSDQAMREPVRPTYRYVLPAAQVVQAPQVIQVPAAQPVNVQCATTAVLADTPGCPSTVRQTKEPVEIVYKKTTYTTVYEPKTTSAVSYEKEPYNAGIAVPVNVPAPTTVTVVAPTPTPALVELVTESVKVEVKQ